MHSQWDRRVIPKWRESKVVASLPESKPLSEVSGAVASTQFDPAELEAHIKDWRENPSLGVAADLLSFSHIPDAITQIVDVALFITETKETVPSPLLQLANHILGKTTTLTNDIDEKSRLYNQAALLKSRLRIDPRNAIAQIDLGRIYAALGQDEKAREKILLAVSLRPDHRFVLRSATRLLVHIKEAERALFLLNKSDRTLHDPWLLAPLISLNEILDKPQKHLRRARSLFASRSLDPSHLSELGGAIATIQMLKGEFKEARKTFNQALIAPNDNTIAQAMWASEYFSTPIKPREEWFNNQFSGEALYYHQYIISDFSAAREAALNWFRDEPFSTRPMKAASFASAVLEEYEQSIQYALKGLLLDKEDVELSNNLIYSIAAQNKISEAATLLHQVILTERRTYGRLSGQTMANIGMLFYRTGQHKEAEEHYRKALSHYVKQNDHHALCLASAFMAREAFLSSASNAQEILLESTDTVKKGSSPASKFILSRFSGSQLTLPSESSPINQLPKFIYDKDRNMLIVKKVSPFGGAS